MTRPRSTTRPPAVAADDCITRSSRQSLRPTLRVCHGPVRPLFPVVGAALPWPLLTARRVVGLVVKVSASRGADLGSIPASGVDGFFFCFFFRSSHNTDLKISNPVTTLPDAWRYRVNAWTGLSGVSIL